LGFAQTVLQAAGEFEEITENRTVDQ